MTRSKSTHTVSPPPKAGFSGPARTLRVGLFGLGTVGTGVAQILTHKRAELRKKTGVDLELARVCVQTLRKKRIFLNPPFEITDRPEKLIHDPSIDIIVEVIGGMTVARRIILDSMKAGKDVVTANKALLAEEGPVIYRQSEETGSMLGCEAAVCGGVPVVRGVEEGLAANRIYRIMGILNGTCNYILTQMSRHGQDYETALSEAQAKGYAEQDPTLDISGGDTAHKLAVLARLAFRREIPFGRIACEGIHGLSAKDIRFSEELGYTVKLIAIGRRDSEDRVELRVHPALLEKDHFLAGVHGVNNACLISGDEVGDVLFYGRGAGERPTASAIVSDLLKIAALRLSGSRHPESLYPRTAVMNLSEVETRYYLRFEVADQPGVMGALTQVLGKHAISLSSVHQKETDTRPVSIVILTHRASERGVRAALAEIRRFQFVKRTPVLLRIES